MEEIKHMLRAQAWERAKGELHSIIATYYGEHEHFERIYDLVDEFIKTVDSEGLAE